MSIRLLPGDTAPGLKLAQVFNRTDFGPVVFDRPSVVALWNAGCVGCLPAIGELAAFADPLGVPVYGVAVWVRDVDATAAAAARENRAAVLALEERLDNTSGLSRGAVTREWLEASGRDGVPSTYVIDGKGVLAWIGDPEDAKAVVMAVLDGTWNVPAARAAWLDAMGDGVVIRKQLMREAMDAMVAGRFEDAAMHIGEAERIAPAIPTDWHFACLKLDVLALSDRHPEAEAHYVRSTRQFRGDATVQTRLALSALRAMPGNVAVARAACEGLAEVTEAEDWASKPTEMRLAAMVLLADARARLGHWAEAFAAIERAAELVEALELSERSRRWGRAEIERLRAEARS